MNLKWLFYLTVFMPILAFTQNLKISSNDTVGNGIHFEQSLDWQQILTKAKSENKYIFIDCYTTWCGPCKQMDKEIYPLSVVGKAVNGRFISLKMQMDTGRNDDESVKKYYADAHFIMVKYKIEGFPSFLFFSPNGEILNRGEGLKQPGDFISMVNEVTNPKKNYYTMLVCFENGTTSLSETSWLARQASLLGSTDASNKIAKEYILRLNKDSILTRSNVEFMREFTRGSKDKGFQILYNNSDSIDRLMRDDIYVQEFIRSIIHKEVVFPEMEKTRESPGSVPDWNSLASIIRNTYNEYYAKMVITAARCSWASAHKNFTEYTKYLAIYQDEFGSKSGNGMMASVNLNNYAWAVFQFSNDKVELTKALSWSSRAVMMYPTAGWMDTYANILYKLGKIEESLMWEEIAGRLSPTDTSIKSNLKKMKSGQPTWPNN